ncbi:MAG TPA: polyribonucleotide nucleotidyltransferase [Acidimicrobiales bacterium]|nr:polyribonucleotide nucleotidyltransferase [Acidimicrobiales bacterium]
MADAISVTGPISGTDKEITLETGKLAGLANGAVTVRIGNTQVLVTATASKPREGIDFFPLTVDIEERMYAAGRIPGSFFRREGRASEDAILTCRLIDRPLRPNFAKGYRNDTHIVGTILGVDGENPYDVIALNGASAALSISGLPFETPIGAVRIAYSVEGEWIPFPTYVEGEASTFEMVVAGRELDNGDIAIMMVEAGGSEKSFEYYAEGAPKVDEAVLTSGLEASKAWIADLIELQRNLRSQVGEVPEASWTPIVDYSDEVFARVSEVATPKLTEVMSIADKAERETAQAMATAEIKAQLEDEFSELPNAAKQISSAIRAVTKGIVRRRIVEDGFRIDGRGTSDLRPLSAEVGLLPTAHGSGLFQRGETQVLNVTTLGMSRMEQMIDTLNPADRKRYIHHYNFPPYSTGEAGFMRGPKRREIGHGALAEKALLPVVPSKEEFPYTLRLVSDVLSSNGSTSMASVCASSLSLMDAGVPIKAPVAGIAMGLVHMDGKYTTLTDILGAEDAFGDMDFKVAGTADAVTALQLDTKIEGIPAEVLADALDQARKARLTILEVMKEAIPAPREDVGPNAPKIVSFEIPVEKIGEVIGPRGKVINAIQDETGADINVDDDGTVGIVSIGSTDRAVVEEAERQVRLIINPPTANVGEVYSGRVVNITKFGAFVNILPGTDGLLHISKIGGGKRIDKVEDVLSLGDVVEVKVDDIDPNGKLSLSLAGEAPSGGSGSRSESRPSGESSSSGDSGRRTTRRRGAEQDSGSGESSRSEAESSPQRERTNVSFKETFDAKAAEKFGDLGPATDRGRGRGRRRSRR